MGIDDLRVLGLLVHAERVVLAARMHDVVELQPPETPGFSANAQMQKTFGTESTRHKARELPPRVVLDRMPPDVREELEREAARARR